MPDTRHSLNAASTAIGPAHPDGRRGPRPVRVRARSRPPRRRAPRRRSRAGRSARSVLASDRWSIVLMRKRRRHSVGSIRRRARCASARSRRSREPRRRHPSAAEHLGRQPPRAEPLRRVGAPAQDVPPPHGAGVRGPRIRLAQRQRVDERRQAVGERRHVPRGVAAASASPERRFLLALSQYGQAAKLGLREVHRIPFAFPFDDAERSGPDPPARRAPALPSRRTARLLDQRRVARVGPPRGGAARSANLPSARREGRRGRGPGSDRPRVSANRSASALHPRQECRPARARSTIVRPAWNTAVASSSPARSPATRTAAA